MALVNQPSWRPTRKLVAMIVAGAIMGVFQTLLRHFWPDHPFTPFMQDIDLWLQGAVMVAVGYFTRNRADEPIADSNGIQELGDSDSGGVLPNSVGVKPEETGGGSTGKQTPETGGEKNCSS